MILFFHQRSMPMSLYPEVVRIMLQLIWLYNISARSLVSITFARYIPIWMLFILHFRYLSSSSSSNNIVLLYYVIILFIGCIKPARVSSNGRLVWLIPQDQLFESLFNRFTVLTRGILMLWSLLQIRGMHTLIRDREISKHDFAFYSDRLIRLVCGAFVYLKDH